MLGLLRNVFRLDPVDGGCMWGMMRSGDTALAIAQRVCQKGAYAACSAARDSGTRVQVPPRRSRRPRTLTFSNSRLAQWSID
jgi:hypothetical protein